MDEHAEFILSDRGSGREGGGGHGRRELTKNSIEIEREGRAAEELGLSTVVLPQLWTTLLVSS